MARSESVRSRRRLSQVFKRRRSPPTVLSSVSTSAALFTTCGKLLLGAKAAAPTKRQADIIDRIVQ